MNTSINYKLAKPVVSIATVLALALASTTGLADTNGPKYTMTVFEDIRQGAKIIDGEYEQAIEKITANPSKKDAIRVETNLCVAYAKAGEVELAEKSCDAAITAIEGKKRFTQYAIGMETNRDARRRYLAIALSNRGVVKAVKGDLESARKDFDEALQLDSRLAAAKTNLERISIAVENAV